MHFREFSKSLRNIPLLIKIPADLEIPNECSEEKKFLKSNNELLTT